MIKDIFKKSYLSIHEKIFDYKTIKKKPSDWTEENVFLTSDISRFTGYYKYDITPYAREVIDCLSPESPIETIAVMKCAQSGFTQGVIIPGTAYIISEIPSNILYMAGDKELVRNSVRTRLDPVIKSAGLSNLIRPNVIKKKNQRTGDTDFSKEFAGGSLIAEGTKNADKLRQISVKYIFADDWEAAPNSDKKEGSIRTLLENRATSYGSTKKIFYISTPAVKQTSNIEPVFLEGDQRKWNWKCPHCKEFIPIEFQIQNEDGTFSGLKWELDSLGALIEDSVHYECQNCKGKIYEKEKRILNLGGKWIPTAKPLRPQIRSYQLNALVIPPGFTSWVDLVYQWLDACPPNGAVDPDKLKAFKNTRLGQTWEEMGRALRVNEMMENNMRSYPIGIVPDVTCQNDGNGKIVLITLACDLGGVMEINNEDVRLDWEIIAHTSNGQTYSINHGSIGTFKRSRKKSTAEKENESNRDKYTYSFGQRFSVWPVLTELIKSNLESQSGAVYNVDIAVIDTGHFTKLAYDFIKSANDSLVVGIKGYAEDDYRRLTKDTPVISRSKEMLGRLYMLQVNQLKDILAANMALKMGMDGFQPSGFMNFPNSDKGKYSMKGYFAHFEAEHRTELKKGDEVVGYAWRKKNSSVENHMMDVYVYNLAAKEIFIDVLRRSHSQNRNLTWEDYVLLIENQ